MLNRRQLFYVAIGVSSGIGLSAGTRLIRKRGGIDFAGNVNKAKMANVSRSSYALGTEVSITALHADQGLATAAVNDAFAELERVEQLMSIYREDSQLSKLNRDGIVESPHPYLVEVLQQAAAMSGKSNGAFDITVQPLWRLFAEAKKQGQIPSDAALARARKAIDWHRVEISQNRIQLRGDGTAITLNGIAQGFAADKATEALRARGVEIALINTGETTALGAKEDGEPWTLGIQHPRHSDAFISLVKLAGRCLATSGDYATTFSDDFLHHHLFDPRTGRSPLELSSVSIAAPSATLADALSTAVFVLGAEKGLELIRDMPHTDALLVLKDGTTRATPGFAT